MFGARAENEKESDNLFEKQNVTEDSIYDFLSNHLCPAVASSLPILLRRIAHDSKNFITNGAVRFYHFLLPKWSREQHDLLPGVRQMWQQKEGELADFMLRHFDVNKDGHISAQELLNMTELLSQFQPAQESWAAWFRREWPLMDWKLGVFLWRSFGGILFLLAMLSIVPGRTHRISAKILRWPILGITYFLVAVELMVYTVIRLFIWLAEMLVARPKHAKLRRKTARAKSYEEWYNYAAELDKSQKRDRWLAQSEDDVTATRYNWAFIRELIKDMRLARSKGDSLLALAVIQQCTRKNVGGVMSEDLFSFSNTGEPKFIVKEFVEEVVATLHWITEEALKIPAACMDSIGLESYEEALQKKVRDEKDKLWKSLITNVFNIFGDNKSDKKSGKGSSASLSEIIPSNSESPSRSGTIKVPGTLPAVHRIEVLAFLKRARAAYGRTALCLSGGAMMGLYHFGHVLGLLEAGILPHIISGTSGGSVVGAVLCTRTDEELRRDLNPEVLVSRLTCFARPWSERLKSVWKDGNLFDFDDWMERIKWFTCGQMTLEEAYRKTGRVFCVTLSSTTKKAPPVLINHLTAPNVTIASAVIASAAVPGFIQPVRLQYKDSDGKVKSQEGETFFDGSIEQDIPVNGLAEMLNCQFFIACQANPHIVPFFFNPKGGVGRPCRWPSGAQEDSWRGGFLLAALEMYLKNDMKAKFRFLRDLEASPGFTSTMLTQEFEGSTTIVPQVQFIDYFKLFSDPNLQDLYRYFQAGSIAAYEHTAMIKIHYSLADTLDHCVERLLTAEDSAVRRRSIVRPRSKLVIPESRRTKGGAFQHSPLKHSKTSDPVVKHKGEESLCSQTADFDDEDEYERCWVSQGYLGEE